MSSNYACMLTADVDDGKLYRGGGELYRGLVFVFLGT